MPKKKTVPPEPLEPTNEMTDLLPDESFLPEQPEAEPLMLEDSSGPTEPMVSSEELEMDQSPLSEQELDSILSSGVDSSSPPEAAPAPEEEQPVSDTVEDSHEDNDSAPMADDLPAGPFGAIMLPSTDEADMPIPQPEEPVEESQPESTAESVPPVRERSERAFAIDQDLQVLTEAEKEGYIWLELRNSLRSKRLLTGRITGVERLPGGSVVAVVEYKGKRVIIPVSELYLDIEQYGGPGEYSVTERQIQIANSMMYAEIDFVVSGLDRRQNTIVGSRKEALRRKQRLYYFPYRGRDRRIVPEMVVEARVAAVGDSYVRVEVFGVECTVLAREVAWEWVDDCHDYYQVGERVLVRIKEIDLSDPNTVHLVTSIRETTKNPALENAQKCVVNGKYVGRVTGVDERAIYVRLNIGVNAIAIAVAERRTPCRRDDVSFVVTRVDEDTGIVIGVITRIIKQYL